MTFRERQKFVSRDLVDSKVISRHLEAGERVLDVGTGGGVPGVVLAVLRDDCTIHRGSSRMVGLASLGPPYGLSRDL